MSIAGQITDHGLKIQQSLQSPLRDLRLIRCVSGVPAGILEDVAANHRWHVAVGVAHPDEGLSQLRSRSMISRKSPEARLPRSVPAGKFNASLSRILLRNRLD